MPVDPVQGIGNPQQYPEFNNPRDHLQTGSGYNLRPHAFIFLTLSVSGAAVTYGLAGLLARNRCRSRRSLDTLSGTQGSAAVVRILRSNSNTPRRTPGPQLPGPGRQRVLKKIRRRVRWCQVRYRHNSDVEADSADLSNPGLPASSFRSPLPSGCRDLWPTPTEITGRLMLAKWATRFLHLLVVEHTKRPAALPSCVPFAAASASGSKQEIVSG